MNVHMFDTVTRRAAGVVSRRRSLLTLGGAALGAIAAPAVAEAGKAGKQARKRCQRQRVQCRNLFVARCNGSINCEEAFLPCCEHFARCDAAAGIECVSPIK